MSTLLMANKISQRSKLKAKNRIFNTSAKSSLVGEAVAEGVRVPVGQEGSADRAVEAETVKRKFKSKQLSYFLTK